MFESSALSNFTFHLHLTPNIKLLLMCNVQRSQKEDDDDDDLEPYKSVRVAPSPYPSTLVVYSILRKNFYLEFILIHPRISLTQFSRMLRGFSVISSFVNKLITSNKVKNPQNQILVVSAYKIEIHSFH